MASAREKIQAGRGRVVFSRRQAPAEPAAGKSWPKERRNLAAAGSKFQWPDFRARQ